MSSVGVSRLNVVGLRCQHACIELQTDKGKMLLVSDETAVLTICT